MRKPVSRKVLLTHDDGLHARPAAMLVNVASRFNAEVRVRLGETTVNAKSILGILCLAAQPGSSLVIIADGDDAVEALNAIEKLFRSGFGGEDHRENVYTASASGREAVMPPP